MDKNLNINNVTAKKRVLIAPLDWGLGHATRCIPIINELINCGFDLLIAASGASASLLKMEFAKATIVPIEGYKISYSKNLLLVKLLLQLPKVMRAITQEKKWIDKIVEEQQIDIVISDNRFGLYAKKAKNVFITHQLSIKTGTVFFDNIAQKINYKFINRFDECWVIDNEDNQNLAGSLSHPIKKPAIPIKYIGVLSRLEKKDKEKNIEVLIMLSGPEPMRTIFEEILFEQTKALHKKIVIVRGLPLEKKVVTTENDNLQIINYAGVRELNDLIQSSKIIIARSGYTSVMDIATLQGKAIYVPTPGQTEQEYLAKYLSQKKYCTTASQQDFNLSKELDTIDESSLISYPTFSKALLIKAIKDLQ
jgi:uncharacterized protein (TIGR00661 family)